MYLLFACFSRWPGHSWSQNESLKKSNKNNQSVQFLWPTQIMGLVTLLQGYGFSSGHVWMWELDYKESWLLKNWCFWTVVVEKTLESPLDCKEIQPVHPKNDQSWVFIGRTDEAETPIVWPPDAKSWLIGKDPDAGRDWGQEEKGMIEDEMAGWHHWLDGCESEWNLVVSDGQGGLVCCDSWGHKESDTTEWLNWTELYWIILLHIYYYYCICWSWVPLPGDSQLLCSFLYLLIRDDSPFISDWVAHLVQKEHSPSN